MIEDFNHLYQNPISHIIVCKSYQLLTHYTHTHTHTHTVPPRITVPPANLTILENTFLSSPPTCMATGEPSPITAWFDPDGNAIPMLGGIPQFGILTRSSSGTYTCVATNRAGQARADFYILVEGKNPYFLLNLIVVEISQLLLWT